MAVLDSSRTPGTTPLRFADVFFGSGEVPADLPIGGVAQRLAKTELQGGGNVTASMGAQAENVSWSGAFYASDNVKAKIELLQYYCVSGQEYALEYWTEKYFGKIKRFQPTYRNINRAGYDIEIVITRDNNGALSAKAPPSVDDTISGLMDGAASSSTMMLAADPKAIAATSSLPGLQQQIKKTGPIGQASAASVASLLTTAQAALAAASAYAGKISSAEQQFVSATQFVTNLSLVVKNIERGQSLQSISVQGTSLFAIAAQYYGDASRAFDLAATNGLASPFLPNKSSSTIVLPPFPKAA